MAMEKKPTGDNISMTGVEMLEYYRQFDPIEQKYSIDNITDSVLRKCKTQFSAGFGEIFDLNYLFSLPETHQRDTLRSWVYSILSRSDESSELASLTKKDFSHVIANLYMIYDTDRDDIENQVTVVSLISDMVIGRYLQIDGLERLFNELYVDFEWEMHMGMDHFKQRMDFYRDHFLHQVRDAFMMDRLLENGGFYKRIYEVLTNPSNSKVSAYFCKMVDKQQQLGFTGTHGKLIEFDSEFIPRNIIIMAAYMAGLFHDIGYPETYLRTLYRRICDFLPNMHRQPNMELPAGLFSMLQNSLLFRVVPYEEIRERVGSEKIDHGTLSALGFLLHFYENGTIIGLEPYKAAAVELAALAIYNHTYHYGITDDKSPNDHRPMFLTNPISYLLRICDDLQEWDRVYFEITHRSNILTCNKCHTPVIGKMAAVSTNSNSASASSGKSARRIYVCNCAKRRTQNDTQEVKYSNLIFKRTFDEKSSFPYRRLYNVQVCDCVSIRAIKTLGEGKCSFDEVQNLLVELKYDPYKLLNVALISPTYAKHRVEELRKIKLLLLDQSHIQRIWLDYFVTANPILIKVRLLEKYFSKRDDIKAGISELIQRIREIIKNSKGKNPDSIEQDFEREINEVLGKHIFPELEKKIRSCYSKAKDKSLIKEYVEAAIKIYVRLCVCHKLFCAFRELHGDETPHFISAMESITNKVKELISSDDVLQCLFDDAILQLSRCYDPIVLANSETVPKDYLDQFTLEKPDDSELTWADYYDTAVDRYTDQQRYTPIMWSWDTLPKDKLYIDAFTDLAFFQYIHDECNSARY